MNTVLMLCVFVCVCCVHIGDVVDVGMKADDGTTTETLEMLEEEERASVQRRRKKLEVGTSAMIYSDMLRYSYGCQATVEDDRNRSYCVYECVVTLY